LDTVVTGLGRSNDVAVSKDNHAYVTDLRAARVYHVRPDGTSVAVISNLDNANGVLLSLDEKLLYVSHMAGIKVYDRNPDGTLANSAGRSFAKTPNDALIDGLWIDDAGNVYAAARHKDQGLWVFKPNGEAWGRVAMSRNPTNGSFGGRNRKTMYVTTGGDLLEVQMPIPGLP
jgi:gluconolactonase